jgi:hypothetical protein
MSSKETLAIRGINIKQLKLNFYMIKSIQSAVVCLFVILFASCNNQKSQEDHQGHEHHDHASSTQGQQSKSPRETAMANIGTTHVHMDYSAPSVRGRQIFGGLVAFGEVWVTGAHSATSISVSDDVEISGKLLPKGKYALFTIPGQDEWTVIINTNYDQHLADEYDAKDDVFRINVKPTQIDTPVEKLEFKVEEQGSGQGLISFSWESSSFSLPIKAVNQ